MRHYIHFANLSATEVSVFSGFYSSGLPAMTAWTGLGHAIGLSLTAAAAHAAAEASADPFAPRDEESDALNVAPSLQVTGVCPVIQAYLRAAGPARRVTYQHGAAKGKPASFAHDPIADLVFDLVLKVDTTLTASELRALLLPSAITPALQSLRLNGGAIFVQGEATVHENLADALMKSHSSAFVFEDAHDVVQAARAAAPAGTSMVSILDELVARDDNKEPSNNDLPYRPRYAVCGVGYRALEEPTARAGSRKNLPHAFAESLLGLVRIRLLASVLAQLKNETPAQLLWAFQPPRNRYFVVAAPKSN